jgi:hypothetical protein
MLKAIYEGNLSAFLKADAPMVAGQLVKLKAGAVDTVVVTGANDTAYGIVAQDVVAVGTDDYKLTSVTAKAKVGEKVGVYFGTGLYYTDQILDNVVVGDKLYCGAGGKFTKTAGTGAVVAVAETAGNAGTQVRIRLGANL